VDCVEKLRIGEIRMALPQQHFNKSEVIKSLIRGSAQEQTNISWEIFCPSFSTQSVKRGPSLTGAPAPK
jgi:hypothetical protein